MLKEEEDEEEQEEGMTSSSRQSACSAASSRWCSGLVLLHIAHAHIYMGILRQQAVHMQCSGLVLLHIAVCGHTYIAHADTYIYMSAYSDSRLATCSVPGIAEGCP